MVARSWHGKESGALKQKNSDLSQKTLEIFRKTLEIFQHLEIVSRFLLENLAALLEILATCPRTSWDLSLQVLHSWESFLHV